MGEEISFKEQAILKIKLETEVRELIREGLKNLLADEFKKLLTSDMLFRGHIASCIVNDPTAGPGIWNAVRSKITNTY